MSYLPKGAKACDMGLEYSKSDSVHASCTTMGREWCLNALKKAIADMQCAEANTPVLWDAETAQRDDEARKAQEKSCHDRFDQG